MDASELALFASSLEAAVRTNTGPELDAALDEIGWFDALGDDMRAAISILFDLQGRVNVRSSALCVLVARALGVDMVGPVVLPMLGTATEPGTIANGRIPVKGLLPAPVPSGPVVVAAGGFAYAVPIVALVQNVIGGLDPAAGLVEIVGDATREALGRVDSDDAVRLGRLTVATEIVDASRRMIELAREHALGRVQYGVPIASFQAVRHRLAESLVAIETVAAGVDAAWLDEAPHHTVIAKALAGRASRTAAQHCQQVLAGIGYTQEHPFHRFFRRVLLLDEMFGSSRILTRELGEELLRAKRLPPVLAL